MRLLQIDTCLRTGSTGRITESIARLAQQQGWECFIVHGARFVKRPSCMQDIQSVSKFGEYAHYVEGLFLDNHGLSSRRATMKVVERIEEIKPDIVHLHCIHGYYLNYKILFEYLNKTSIPVIWTFHDCWAFTGHCAHFVTVACEKWKSQCENCPRRSAYPKSFVDHSRRNFALKKELFTANMNLHIVPVSEWLAGLTKDSFLKDKDMRVIHNGVDVSVFKPVNHPQGDKVRVLGVSGVWTKSKGIEDFYRLREILDEGQFDIILVGLSKEQKASLPNGIIGITHTESIGELASLYASADVFFNPTYADTFPTVNIEALACGTPVLTYRTGGSPEAVSEETGWVIEQGNLGQAVEIIQLLWNENADVSNKRRLACRKRAEEVFDKEECFEKYLRFYGELLADQE